MLPFLRGLAILALAAAAVAAEHHGQVKFNGLPVPGATVTATHGAQTMSTVTDENGGYSFTDLTGGTWTVSVAMACFAPLRREVAVGNDAAVGEWELKLLSLQEMNAAVIAALAPPKPARKNEATKPADPVLADRAADGLLVNGSVNNGASSPFAQIAAFGNNRRNLNNLYNGGFGLILDNSALDARSFSLTGQDTPKPAYNHMQLVGSFGGVVKIPHLIRNGPVFFIGYQWTRNRTVTVESGLVPDANMRMGELPDGTIIPRSRISPQALSLLTLYPLPNFSGGGRYNYQIPVTGALHQDSLESRLTKTINQKNQVYGGFSFQSNRSDTPNLFNFLDTGTSLGLSTNVNWRHAFASRLYGTYGLQFSRMSVRTTPFFANRQNISGAAGITGNNQDAVNWGPPSLVFSSGISPLTDAQAATTHNQTTAVSAGMLWLRGRHNVQFGADYKRLQFNSLSQQDPRGSFTFNGAATGSDFGGFLQGIPDTSSIAFGNADKYFRSSSYDAFVSDDMRLSPELTLTAGLRWEYGSPITELYGRLVNLDIAPGFGAVAPVIAASPVGSLTGRHYPGSLVEGDPRLLQPRLAIAWRPLPGSSVVVRAGYGVYANTSVYQNIATQMAQQSPLSKSLSVQNTPDNPLTLANGFIASPRITPNTFAIDPHFRVGYAQNWTISLQRDLPGSLVMIATYAGIKGTRGTQEFLPNTYPSGGVNPCPLCPSGFVFLTSNGNSTRESGQIELRRRLHNGITASIQYTYAKAIDDSALGGRGQGISVIAQNWLDLGAERALSTFDQRHLVNLNAQYTTGMGMGGGGLMRGWRGRFFKEWTVSNQITIGSGLPLTPNYLSAVNGTGVTGPLRPDYTGAPLYHAPAGLFLNPAAYAAPAPGHWGNAGRDSITGPGQFTMNSSLGRTFRLRDRLNVDLRFDAANALNHVTFTSWYTTITSAQFGLPVAANAMRSVQTTLRVRF